MATITSVLVATAWHSFSSWHGWTWPGWAALVAVGTGGLAAATFVLAMRARRANIVAQLGIAVSQSELRASLMPILESVPERTPQQHQTAIRDVFNYSNVGGPPDRRAAYPDTIDVDGTAGYAFCSIPIQNVGPGVALVDAKPRALSVPDALWTEGEITRPLIPSTQTARLHFPMRGIREEIYAEVEYSDIAGEQRTRLRLYVKGERISTNGEMVYFVRGTALYDVDSGVRIAIAGDATVLRSSAQDEVLDT